VAVYTSDYSSGPYGGSSFPDYLSVRSESRTLIGVAAQDNDSGVVQIGGRVERLAIAAVTGDYFATLGVGTALGRTLSDADTQGDAPGAVISHRLWTNTLGGDPAILGRPLTANGRSYTIVGVVDERFVGLDLGYPVQVWTPLVPPAADPAARGNRGLAVFARLRPGASLREAQLEIGSLAERLAAAYPETNRGTLAAPDAPRPMFVLRHSLLPPDVRPLVATIGALLVGAVAIVLLIACANVAGLLVSRAIARQREVAVRLAVGASRWRIVRQLLTESLLLGLTGGACGLLIALWTVNVLPSFLPAEQAEMLDTSVGGATVACIAAISMLASLLVGTAPALHAARSPAVVALRGGDGAQGWQLRRLLVAGQIAAAVVLLVSSALLVRSLANALGAGLGFGTRDGVVLTAELPPGTAPAARQQYFDALVERVRSLPGVRSAGVARDLPLTRTSRRFFTVDGYEPRQNEDMELHVNVVSDRYFETMQIPVRAGRTFDRRDHRASAPVVIVNDVFADRFFAGEALGKRIHPGRRDSTQTLEVIGIVQSPRYLTMQGPPAPMVYFPLAQQPIDRATLAVRVDGSPSTLVEPIRRAAAAVDSKAPVYRAMTLGSYLDESTATDRMTASLVSVCGAMALLLATLGLYGVIAYAAVKRAREIGIRVALGARPPDVARLVAREGLAVVAIGIAVGLAAAVLAARGLASLTPLHGVGPFNPITYAGVTAILIGVALLAAVQPTRRALRLDPGAVLRVE
jgi:predicted permease